jgi:hypothetical protein
VHVVALSAIVQVAVVFEPFSRAVIAHDFPAPGAVPIRTAMLFSVQSCAITFPLPVSGAAHWLLYPEGLANVVDDVDGADVDPIIKTESIANADDAPIIALTVATNSANQWIFSF